MRAVPAAIALFGLLFAACSPAASKTAAPPVTPGAKTGAGPTAQAQIVSSDDDPGGSAAEVFERAKIEFSAKSFQHARVLFDRVVIAANAEGPAALPLARSAAYDAALCSESLGEAKDARDRFRALAQSSEQTPEALDANLRRARLDVEIEDWTDLAQASSSLLARPDLLDYDRAEALGHEAIALIVGKQDLAAGQKSVNAAVKLLQKKGPDDIPPPQNAAVVHFARGELLRAQGNAIVFIDPANPTAPINSADLPMKLENRCQKILDAEEAYIDAIKTKEVNWGVRSGLRVASMYVDLHEALMAIPPPKAASTDEKKALIRGALRLRYRILLEKGLGTLERTINLEKAAAANTGWLAHAKKAKTDVEKLLEDEKAELKKLPYTEEQLQKALDDLGKGNAPPPPPAKKK
ncbi:MAG: hypothetical protein ACXVEF_10800 [Polyangiales bacterium]